MEKALGDCEDKRSSCVKSSRKTVCSSVSLLRHRVVHASFKDNAVLCQMYSSQDFRDPSACAPALGPVSACGYAFPAFNLITVMKGYRNKIFDAYWDQIHHLQFHKQHLKKLLSKTVISVRIADYGN